MGVSKGRLELGERCGTPTMNIEGVRQRERERERERGEGGVERKGRVWQGERWVVGGHSKILQFDCFHPGGKSRITCIRKTTMSII